MARVELTVIREIGNGTESALMIVDRMEVVFIKNKGKIVVDGAAPSHGYRYWFAGPPSATFSYEIKRGDDSIVKKKTKTIDEGQHSDAGHGTFKLS